MYVLQVITTVKENILYGGTSFKRLRLKVLSGYMYDPFLGNLRKCDSVDDKRS